MAFNPPPSEMEADLEAEEREMQLELEKELREIDKSFSKSGNKCRFVI